MSSFTPKNERFGRRAHEVAWEEVYQEFLPDGVILRDLQGTDRDYYRDEDREAMVHLEAADRPLRMSIQERFRRIEYESYRDVTIAASYGDLELHLSDTDADILVYGFFDDDAGELGETIVLSVSSMKYALATGSVEYEFQEHGSKDHRFICLSMQDLIGTEACLHHADPKLEHDPIETYTRGEDIRQFRDSDYFVTRDGHVWSENQGGCWISERRRNGYRQITMSGSGPRTALVHRLVAEVFHRPPPSEEHQVHHINGVRYDNRAENLEWVTRGENMQATNAGEMHREAILNEEQVEEIRRRYRDENLTQKEIAEEYGMSESGIGPVIRGRNWPNAEGPIKGVDY